MIASERTREIGVSVSLGARSSSILWSILHQSGSLLIGGASIGAFAGMQLVRLRIFTFALPEPGLWLFPALVGVMALAGLLARWVPARRALSIQPVEAMRYDS